MVCPEEQALGAECVDEYREQASALIAGLARPDRGACIMDAERVSSIATGVVKGSIEMTKSATTGAVKGSISMTKSAINTSVSMTSKAVQSTGNLTGKAVMGTVNTALDTTYKAGALTRAAAGNLKDFSSRCA
jgi:hypothetical protein